MRRIGYAPPSRLGDDCPCPSERQLALLTEGGGTFKELLDYTADPLAFFKGLSYIAFLQDAVGSCPR